MDGYRPNLNNSMSFNTFPQFVEQLMNYANEFFIDDDYDDYIDLLPPNEKMDRFINDFRPILTDFAECINSSFEIESQMIKDILIYGSEHRREDLIEFNGNEKPEYINHLKNIFKIYRNDISKSMEL